MSAHQYDLVIRAGRLFCDATGLDGPGAVAVRADRIVATGPAVVGSAALLLEYPDGLLLPGLVDLHAHPGYGDSRFDVDPDVHYLPRGVTTVLSQGDAGALNWPEYRGRVIEAARTRVRLAINLSKYGESRPGITFEGLQDADVAACVAAIEDGGGAIWGIAVNIIAHCLGSADPRDIMGRALEAATATDRPLLFGGRREPDWSLAEQLALLRPGDIFTYCLSGGNQTILRDGRVREEVWDARRRGVLFDVGSGVTSFSYDVAETAIAEGFLPDTISTDSYRRHIGVVPTHDFPRVISKLIAAGMPENEALARATARPAGVLGLAGEVGTLAPGACADLAVLRWNDRAAELRDGEGIARPGACLEPVLTVRAGEIVARAP